MSTPHTHQSHPSVINRLKRTEGHLRKVIRMLEEGRPCPEIAQQLQAVESAVSKAKTVLIEDHLDHCLDEVFGSLDADQKRELDGLKTIARYL